MRASLSARIVRTITQITLRDVRLGDLAPQCLGQSPARLDGLPLLLHRGFLIGPAQLELFEKAALRELVFEDLQGLFHIIVKYFYFQISPPFRVRYFLNEKRRKKRAVRRHTFGFVPYTTLGCCLWLDHAPYFARMSFKTSRNSWFSSRVPTVTRMQPRIVPGLLKFLIRIPRSINCLYTRSVSKSQLKKIKFASVGQGWMPGKRLQG